MNILLFMAPKPNLKRTVRFTREIASATQAKVYLLAVCQREESQAEFNGAIEWAQDILGDYIIETSIRFGNQKKVLMTELLAGKYDVLIYGYRQVRGKDGRRPSLLAREVISQANLTVIVVKEVHTKIGRILICTSGSRVATAVIRSGAHFALALKAGVTLLHVLTAVPSMYTGLDELDETLSELLDTDTPIARELRRGAEILAGSNLNAELKLRRGVVSDEILREVNVGGYDLVVLGASRMDQGLQAWLLGDVTSKIVEQSHIPVMIVSHGQKSLDSDQDKE